MAAVGDAGARRVRHPRGSRGDAPAASAAAGAVGPHAAGVQGLPLEDQAVQHDRDRLHHGDGEQEQAASARACGEGRGLV